MTDMPDAIGSSGAGLRVLLTNNSLGNRAGSELYLRDLAIELMKRGHFPIAYSPVLGVVAEELRRATIPVIGDLSDLSQAPDIIHGQHHLETMTAVLRFPQTPAIYVCHGWLPWEELPPVFPTISDYVAVDDLCRERLLTTKGIAPENVSVIRNFVDTDRFAQRRDWASHPKSAMIFSNTATLDDPRTLAITSACAAFGIGHVDVFGEAVGKSHQEPERILDRYDIVFAKARCAIEAMASGAAVIVTDYAGLAGMVTSARFGQLRSLNFGARTMQAKTISHDSILSELRLYDVRDVRIVSELIRNESNLTSAADEWLSVYRRVIARHNQSAYPEFPSLARQGMDDASRYLRFLAPVIKTITAAERASSEAVRRASEAVQYSTALQEELEACRKNALAKSDDHESIVTGLVAKRDAFESDLNAERLAHEQLKSNLDAQRLARDELQNDLNAERIARDQDAIELVNRGHANSTLSQTIAALTDDMAAAIAVRDGDLARLRAEAAREAENLNAQLASFRGELNAIQTSRAWKAVQRYGRMTRWLRK